ncbi:tetratricopeptide repeat protein [Flavobacteriaceae bacterium]|nr:tetratricopeptide repeat protein [Flavobacteriaceae bacterium]
MINLILKIKIIKTPIKFIFVGVFVLFIQCNSNSTKFEAEKVSISFEDVEEQLSIGNQDEAFNLLVRIYDDAKAINDYELMSDVAGQISALFRKSGILDNAIRYGKESYKWADSSGNKMLVIDAEIKLAKAYVAFYNEGEHDEIDPYLESQVDTANIHFQKALDLALEARNSEYFKVDSISIERLGEYIGNTYSNLSAIAFTNDEYDEAKRLAQDSYSFFLSINDTLRTSIALNNLGNAEISMGHYSDASIYYNKAIQTINKYDSIGSYKRQKADLLINYSYCLDMLGDLDGYDRFYEAYELEAEIKEAEMDDEIVELERQWNVETVKKEAAARQKEQEKESEQFKYFSVLLFILTLVLIATFFVFYKGSQLKQKNLELQIDKEQLVQKAELERVEKLSQTKVLNATIDGRESERKLIAEILHDSVSSLLSSANLHLQASRNVYSEVPDEIDKSQRIIEEASEKIRNLSHELISSVLLKFGLSYSIFDLCEKYSNSQIEIVSDINHVRRYDQSFEIKMNNIIEELVNNILKHSKASEAIITLEERDEQLYLEITDNGEGFKFDELIKKDGLGLNQIKARVQMMKGSIDIDSIPTQGTTINIIVPIVEREVRKREMA